MSNKVLREGDGEDALTNNYHKGDESSFSEWCVSMYVEEQKGGPEAEDIRRPNHTILIRGGDRSNKVSLFQRSPA